MPRRLRTSRLAAASAAIVVAVLMTGCGPGPRGDVGTIGTGNCPHRNAYCPVDGPGVARPGRPADSPSGRFQLRVLPASPVTAGENWRFEVVDKATKAVVLNPKPGMDGGLGVVVAWDQHAPETVWASRPEVSRWQPGGTGRPWVKGIPAPGEALPPVVAQTKASDPG